MIRMNGVPYNSAVDAGECMQTQAGRRFTQGMREAIMDANTLCQGEGGVLDSLQAIAAIITTVEMVETLEKKIGVTFG